ncbi:sulfate transporter CysZ [Zophobihabitans entericus]|uniref:Sulfate transporter CysZ n=1 Tax=Zophobihabitans entericus TaxID=1635327 RepID=A0A6G9ICH0_9GAMM|nr:sulfate transporter CysZ [Zophobihabitans entericus]QIQ21928.1 sulfate transporter CysZ [Zophobihabitans entericus]
MERKTGIDYFVLGWKLIQKPGITRFVILPMLANIVVMSLLFWWLFAHISTLMDLGMHYVPSWLQWLSYIVTLIVVVTMAIFFCYFFSTITNIIAAPFNGLLAEQVEAYLTQQPAPDTGIWSLVKDIPRILKREVYKLIYYILWAIPLFFLYWIPVFGQTVAPIIWFIFTAWMINIQYADYAFDNHKVSFSRMREMLKQDKADNLSFGALVSLFTMIPVFNLIIMPVAVCGSTALWVDRYRQQVYEDQIAERISAQKSRF